jgi:hypothetical protein
MSVVDLYPELQRLASLCALDYESERGPASARLGVRLSTLDAEVEKRRPQTQPVQDQTDRTTRRILEPVTPWAEPVVGDHLLSELKQTARRFLVLTDEQASTVALWTVLTPMTPPIIRRSSPPRVR